MSIISKYKKQINKLKVGDWCFYEFKLVQIEEIDGDCITVNDGFFRTTMFSIRNNLIPLTLHTKVVSDSVDYHYKRMHQIHINSENHELFVRYWFEMCLKLNTNYEKCYEFLKKFENYSIN